MAPPGARFGKYELLRRLGHGGMAEVYLARQDGPAGFAKQVVLKQVLPQHVDKANFRAMFLDEARLAARLTHPNICQVFDLGEVDGRFFLAMEFVDGLTVSQLLSGLARRSLQMPLDATMRVVGAVLEALHAAHTLTDEAGQALQVVHRDVTPSNVMVTAQGSVKLLDFGIARVRGRSTETRVGMAKGKLGYMAPEQLRSQPLDARTDVFQVGALLYHLVLGKGPYAASMGGPTIFDDMAATRFPPPRSVDASVPAALEAIILTAMRRAPAERYQSALDMHVALEAFARQHQLSMGPQVLTTLIQTLSGEFDVPDEAEVVALGSADLIEGNTTTVRGRPARDGGAANEPGGGTVSVVQPARARRRGPSAAVLVAVAVTAVGVGLGASLALGFRASGEPVALPEATSLHHGGDRLLAHRAPGGAAHEQPPSSPAQGFGEPARQDGAKRVPNQGMLLRGVDVVPRDRAGSTPGESPSVSDEGTGPPVVVASPDEPPVPGRLAPGAGPEARAASRPARSGSAAPRATVPDDEGSALAGGTLDVQCEPAAKVRVAGRLVGSCPMRVPLPEGMHRIVLEYPGAPPRTLLVTILPGVTTPLFDRR
ncbi:MAG: protein kinase [Myxococcaceae bacterium]|nr:protein kinase [Myxococcaceae bacterium]